MLSLLDLSRCELDDVGDVSDKLSFVTCAAPFLILLETPLKTMEGLPRMMLEWSGTKRMLKSQRFRSVLFEIVFQPRATP